MKKGVLLSIICAAIIFLQGTVLAASGNARVTWCTNAGATANTSAIQNHLINMGYSTSRNSNPTKSQFLSYLNANKVLFIHCHGLEGGGAISLSDGLLYSSSINSASTKLAYISACYSGLSGNDTAVAKKIALSGATSALGFTDKVKSGTQTDRVFYFNNRVFSYLSSGYSLLEAISAGQMDVLSLHGSYYGTSSAVVFGNNYAAISSLEGEIETMEMLDAEDELSASDEMILSDENYIYRIDETNMHIKEIVAQKATYSGTRIEEDFVSDRANEMIKDLFPDKDYRAILIGDIFVDDAMSNYCFEVIEHIGGVDVLVGGVIYSMQGELIRAKFDFDESSPYQLNSNAPYISQEAAVNIAKNRIVQDIMDYSEIICYTLDEDELVVQLKRIKGITYWIITLEGTAETEMGEIPLGYDVRVNALTGVCEEVASTLR